MRDAMGRFAREYKIKRRISVFGIAVLFGIIGVDLLGDVRVGNEVSYVAPKAEAAEIAIEMKGKSLETLKDELIHELAKKENLGGVPCYQDDNSRGSLPKKDKISCGVMSYKISTIQRHAKGCYGSVLNDNEAVILALDEARAKELAKCAIFGEQDAVDEWMGATEKMKLKVELIREIEGV